MAPKQSIRVGKATNTSRSSILVMDKLYTDLLKSPTSSALVDPVDFFSCPANWSFFPNNTMLSITSVLFCVYTIITVVSCKPVNVPIGSPSPASSPVCVNSSEHNIWSGSNNGTINPYYCAFAVFGIMLSVGNKKTDEYQFFSKGNLQGVAAEGTWGLPQSTRSSTCKSSPCRESLSAFFKHKKLS